MVEKPREISGRVMPIEFQKARKATLEVLEGSNAPKRFILKALTTGDVLRSSPLCYRFGLSKDDIAEWPEYEDAVFTGLNQPGESGAFYEDDLLLHRGRFFYMYAEGIIDLNRCPTYLKILAATISHYFHSEASQESNLVAAKNSLRCFGPGVEPRSLLELDDRLTEDHIRHLES